MERLINLMSNTDKFVYPSQSNDIDAFLSYARIFAESIEQSAKRQYIESDRNNPIIRLSSLGKTPAFELLAKKLGIIGQNTASNVKENNRLIFATGDYYEAWLEFTLHRIGYRVVAQQTDVNWHGVGGHTDFIIEDEFGNINLLECKSANDYYYNRVNSFGVGDDRGYLTQLLTYQDCLQIPAYWVFLNKNNCEMSIIPLESIDEDSRKTRLHRAKCVVDAFNKCESTKDLYTLVRPVPPAIEKRKDGSYVLDENDQPKLYVPHEVSHPEIMYVLEEGMTSYRKPRLYVKDYLYPKEFESYKPDVLKDAINHDTRNQQPTRKPAKPKKSKG